MTALLLRLMMLLGVMVVVVGVIWLGRRFIGRRQQSALAAPAYVATSITTPVSISAFHTEDCRQCFTMQAPALTRVQAARSDVVGIIDIDAIAQSALAAHYHVLTVPSTVVLDAQGKAYAVNYGFTPTHRLLQQVDAVLAQAVA